MTTPTPEQVEAVEMFVHTWLVDCHIGPSIEGEYYCGAHDEFTANDAYCGTVGEYAQRILRDQSVRAALGVKP